MKARIIPEYAKAMMISDQIMLDISSSDYVNPGMAGIISKLDIMRDEILLQSQLSSIRLPVSIDFENYRKIFPSPLSLPKTLDPGTDNKSCSILSI